MKQNYIFLKLLSVLVFICFSPTSLAKKSYHAQHSLAKQHLTIRNGTPSEIKTMLKNKNTNLEARDQFHRTLIHLPTQDQNIKLTQQIIQKGANVDAQDSQGMTIAHMAAKVKNVALLEVILDANPNLDLINNMGRNAFLTAVHEGHIDVVKLFIKYQPELLNSTDINGMTGVQIAFKAKKISMVTALQELEVNTSKVKNLNGSEVDTQFQDKKERLINNFYTAIRNGHQTVVQTFFNNNPELIDIEQENKSGLHVAAYYNQPEIIQLLLNWGVDANKLDSHGWPPVLTAVKTGDIKTAQQFTNYDPEAIKLTAGEVNQTAAHIVIIEASKNKSKSQRWTKMLRWLVEQGINLQTKNKHGQTVYDLAKKTSQTYLLPYYGLEKTAKKPRPTLHKKQKYFTTTLTSMPSVPCRKAF